MYLSFLVGGLLLLLSSAQAQYAVTVSESYDLLQALYDQSVTSIQLSADIKFGPEFSLISPPYIIQRNVTLFSPPGEMHTLNAAFYSDIFVLDNGVVVEFDNIYLLKFHRTPLAPGKLRLFWVRMGSFVTEVTKGCVQCLLALSFIFAYFCTGLGDAMQAWTCSLSPRLWEKYVSLTVRQKLSAACRPIYGNLGQMVMHGLLVLLESSM